MIVSELLGTLSVRASIGVAAATGLDRAGRTPAEAHIPSHVPGPPTDHPVGPPPGTRRALGTDSAGPGQSPAGSHRDR